MNFMYWGAEGEGGGGYLDFSFFPVQFLEVPFPPLFESYFPARSRIVTE